MGIIELDNRREVIQMIYKTGEKPGKGTYICTKCGQKVVLYDTTDTLPPCPKCNGTEFRKA
ncbi:MAG: DNA-directed RNA polymerase subunit RPC12/RpoP [Clostridium sp.]